MKSWLKSIFYLYACVFKAHHLIFYFKHCLLLLVKAKIGCQFQNRFLILQKSISTRDRENLSSSNICRPFSIKLFTKCSFYVFFSSSIEWMVSIILPRFWAYWMCTVHTIIGWEAVNGWRLDTTYVQINRQTFVLFIICYFEHRLPKMFYLIYIWALILIEAMWNEMIEFQIVHKHRNSIIKQNTIIKTIKRNGSMAILCPMMTLCDQISIQLSECHSNDEEKK